VQYPYVNEVRMVGRVSGEPRRRTLSSGAELVEWRLVVERSSQAPGRAGRRVVDTFGCVAYDAPVRAAAHRWQHGDLLSVRGALRRMFWRVADRTASRYQIEVHRAEPLAMTEDARAGPRS
jgi:single-strand DNA-binding protein